MPVRRDARVVRPTVLVALALTFVLPAAARIQPEDALPLAARTPVVLIHGWNATAATWQPFLQRAQANPALRRRVRFYRFSYDWSQPIAGSAESLRQDLAGLPELADRPVVLVGHSMGGLVARSVAELRAPGWSPLERIGAVITLATPHHGSPAANLEWLTGRSQYSLAAKLFPVGLMELLTRIPMLAAVRTQGGQDLGWDNFQGAMPPTIWASANRYLRRLNSDLIIHPERDEWLRRYTFHAGYLTSVGELSLISLPRWIRAGEHYAAGGALVAHAFRDGQGEPIDRWLLNDGIVPLESALFLKPGPPLHDRRDGRIVLYPDRIQQRLIRPGLLGEVIRGADHSSIITNEQLQGRLFAELAAMDFNGLLLGTDRGTVLVRPHGPAPVTVAPLAEPVAAPAGDAAVVRGSEPRVTVGLATPDGTRLVARAAESTGAGWPSPDGTLTVLPDGAVVGVTRSAYVRLPGPATAGVWSPDSRYLAATVADGTLHLVTLGGLRVTPAAAPVDRYTPLAWSADGQLLAATGAEAATAVFHPQRTLAALTSANPEPRALALLNPDGSLAAQAELPATTNPALCLWTGDAAPERLAESAAEPVWDPQGSFLAWIDGADRRTVVLRAGDRVVRHETPGPVVGLTSMGEAALLAAVTTAGGGTLLRLPWTGPPLGLADLPATPTAPPTLSPDARYAAVPLGDTVAVVELNGAWQTRLTGRSPVWLPLPAARRWEPEPAALP